MNFAFAQYTLNLAKNLCTVVRFIVVHTDEVVNGMARA